MATYAGRRAFEGAIATVQSHEPGPHATGRWRGAAARVRRSPERDTRPLAIGAVGLQAPSRPHRLSFPKTSSAAGIRSPTRRHEVRGAPIETPRAWSPG